jgi:uncharacterized protein (TIGR03067 family)
MLRLTAIAFVTTVLGGSVALSGEHESAEAKKLQGEWQAVEIQAKGKTSTKDDGDVKNLRFVIKGDGITIPNPSEEGKERKQTFKVNAAKSPKEMDITSLDGQEKDKTAACIYKLDKDRLTICIPYFTENPSVRPTEFKAGANDGIMLITLERVKSK